MNWTMFWTIYAIMGFYTTGRVLAKIAEDTVRYPNRWWKWVIVFIITPSLWPWFLGLYSEE